MTGPELRAIRQALRETQEQFAERLGVHPITVSKYETEDRPIPKTVERLAMTFNAEALNTGTSARIPA